MKYLVAADGENLDAKVARRFGHATAHLVVDTDDWSVEVFGDDPEELPQHGLSRFLDLHLAGVVSGNIGPHAWQDITDLGLTLYIARRATVKEALEKIASGEIAPAEGPTLKRSIHDGRAHHPEHEHHHDHHGHHHDHHDHHHDHHDHHGHHHDDHPGGGHGPRRDGHGPHGGGRGR